MIGLKRWFWLRPKGAIFRQCLQFEVTACTGYLNHKLIDRVDAKAEYRLYTKQIQALKQEEDQSSLIVREWGRRLGRLIVGTGWLGGRASPPLLVAVPDHAGSPESKGIRLVIEEVGRQLGVEVDNHVLCRSKPMKKSIARNRFCIVPHLESLRLDDSKVKGRHIILVDDVLVSGTTLKAVAQLMHQAEAASVVAAVLAISCSE